MSADTESRYLHLLQPIRDLAQNWNIDIASELEEYLQELEKITFSFEDVGKTLNFAEAALLIQGSTCIYSKKVEYLYLLLYQTLDFLIERKKQRTSVDKEGNDRDVAEFEEKETEFLTLDDIEESDNIDLVESPHRRMETRLKEYALTRAPLALMPLSAEEGVSDGTRRTDFRMNTCAVHPSGALLLEDEDKLSGKNSIWENNGSTNQKHNRDHTNVEFEVGGLRRSHIGDDDDDDVQEDLTDDDEEIDEEAKRRAEAAKNAQEGEGSTVMAQLRERMENDGGGFVATNAQQQQQGQGSSTTTRKKLMEKERITEEHEEPVQEDPVDYWATLNPHLNELQERPLKKGKTWKLPESLGGPSASTKRKRGGKDKPPPSSEESNKTEEDEQEQGQEDVCSLRSVRGPYLPEFKYLYALEMKRRLNARKQVRESKNKKKKGGVEIFYGYEEEEEEIQQMSAAHQQVELVDGLDRFEQIEQDYMASNNLASGGSSSAAASSSGDNAVPFDGYGHDDFGFPTAADDDDDDDVDDGLLPMHSSFSSANGDGAPPPMALDDGGTDWMGSNYSAASAGGIEHCESYEDLCRRHIENYLSSAEAFAVETSLSKRVGQWKSKLEPILEEQSLHPNFDIHDYGERILERFPVRKMVPPREQQQEDDPQADEEEERQGVVVGFESLVDGDEVYEVCRKFAAILQLANNGNIDIIRPQKHDRMITISAGEQQDNSTGVGPLDHGIKLRLLSSIPLTFESVDSISLETVQGDEAEVEQNGPSSRRKASDKRKRRTEEEEDGEEEEDELSEEKEDEEEEEEEKRPQKNTRKKGAEGKRKGSKEQASSKTKKQETTKPNGNKKERARVAQLKQDNKENEEDTDNNERRSTAATTSNKSKPTTARTATTAAARRRDKGKEKVYDDIPSPASRSVRQPFALVNC